MSTIMVNRDRHAFRQGSKLRRLRRGICLALLLMTVGFAAKAAEPDLPRQVLQGSLVQGRVEPGTELRLEGRRLRVGRDGGFVFGVGRNATGPLELELRAADGLLQRHPIRVVGRDYRIQRIDGLPPRSVEPTAEDLVRIKADQLRFDATRRLDSPETGFAEPAMLPLAGRISGVYGSQRILNGKPRSPHRGVDIAAPEGAPVVAMAPGRVKIAQSGMYFTGGTVVIDHGHGVQSLYAHLSEILVEEGQPIARGSLIGKVGATGRATGPHLHWGVFWFDQAVDPLLLVSPGPPPPKPFDGDHAAPSPARPKS
jgi:murein DD-endopeptidase MepM/ murein hydrolase activator NlpD